MPELPGLVERLVRESAERIADAERIESEIAREVNRQVRELADPDRRREEVTSEARQLAEQWTRERMALAHEAEQGRPVSHPVRELPAASRVVRELPAGRPPPRGIRGGWNRS
jgi:hypothetical protein